jgi:hypothetical protein
MKIVSVLFAIAFSSIVSAQSLLGNERLITCKSETTGFSYEVSPRYGEIVVKAGNKELYNLDSYSTRFISLEGLPPVFQVSFKHEEGTVDFYLSQRGNSDTIKGYFVGKNLGGVDDKGLTCKIVIK